MNAGDAALEAGIRLATLYPVLAFGIIVAIALIVAIVLMGKSAERQMDKMIKRFDAAMEKRDEELDELKASHATMKAVLEELRDRP